jgi:hypothetical protein
MEEMDKEMIRQGLLADLIDSMHGRLADKLYPSDVIPMPNPAADDKPAAAEIPGSEAAVDEKMVDTDKDAEDMSDEDLEEMMKGMK